MNGCVVAEKTLVCYKRDDKPCTNKQQIYVYLLAYVYKFHASNLDSELYVDLLFYVIVIILKNKMK